MLLLRLRHRRETAARQHARRSGSGACVVRWCRRTAKPRGEAAVSVATGPFAPAARGRSSAPESVAGKVARSFRALVRRHREARAIEHLESLSDHSLKDIGIARSEIALVVRWGQIARARGRHVPD